MHILLIHQAYVDLNEAGGTRHAEMARLSRIAGEPEEARAATRAAKILLARHGADRNAPRLLPLQALYAAARLLDGEDGSETGSREEAAPPGPDVTKLS